MGISLLSHARPPEILLVEDNPNDVELTKLAFKKSNFSVNLHFAKNGEECMMFLKKDGKFKDTPSPDLVLLDLNMPRMDGREVMQNIAQDERFRYLPVVIMTTSEAEKDILECYKHRCSSYIVKPVDFQRFAKMVESLGSYWFTLVVLPPQHHQRDH